MLKFIVNPNSGGETGFSTWKTCERRLQKLGIEYKVYITDGPGDAVRLAHRATKNDEEVTVVPVGGDGTFNEVLNGLNLSDKVTLGYIPTGSGNDLARGLNISKNPLKALDVILERKNIIKVDYGVLTYGNEERKERRFAVSTGIGYDAAVCVSIDNSNLRRGLSKVKMQKSVYITLGALEILKAKPSNGYLIVDDERRIETKDIMFISSQIYAMEGGGKAFAPQADPHDGKLSLCIMTGKSKLKFTKTLFDGLKGNHVKDEHAKILDCKKVKIHVDTPFAVHTDGEIIENQTDVEVRCVADGINFIL